MGRGIKPDFQFRAVTDFDSVWLRNNGFKGVLLDMDNTLTPWKTPAPSAAVLAWRKELRAGGVKACIVSNSRQPVKVARVAAELEMPYIHRAGKPRRRGFDAGQEALELPREEILVVGDQIFTDVAGGNLARMRTCLICPISRQEFLGTKFLRLLERLAGRAVRFQAD
ncbi:MAG: YqeG family HAD IIIA-type phosphatase [Gracilibacteraceae bacterium]|nr:YqeG family HAD IIIA-type phosphatase [Gracilibacteraceae bacterium]